MKPVLVFVGVALAALRFAPVVAAPLPALDAAALTKKADVIVAGRVTGRPVIVEGRHEGLLSLFVERIIKGNTDMAGSALQVRVSFDKPVSSHIADGSFGLFFLDCSSYTYCVPADSTYPSLVAVPEPIAQPSSARTLAGRIAFELTEVLQASDALLAEPATGLSYLGSGENTSRRAQAVRSRAVEALATLPPDFAIPELLKAVQSKRTATRLSATAALVQLREFSALPLVESQMVRPSAITQSDVRQIANPTRAIQSPPETLIMPMTRWLRSTDVEVRRAAANVLSNIRSRAVISPLARIALSDTDQDVRYYAVSGLVENAGDGKVPSLELFKQREGEYMSTWKARTNEIDPR